VLGAHDENGEYAYALTAGNTDTLGILKIRVTNTTVHLPLTKECRVLSANVYDSIYAGTDYLDVNVEAWDGLTFTGANMIEDDGGTMRYTTNALEQGPGGGGGVDVVSFLGTSITEGTAGDIANNFTQFFDVNPTSTQDINDVGGGGSGGDFVTLSGTCDSGSTTTCVDANLTESDNHWHNQRIRFTSGSITGQTVRITDFDAASDRITFEPAVNAAVTTNTYDILPAAIQDGGYEDNAIWFNSFHPLADTGTVVGVDGTRDNPSTDASDVRALLAASDFGRVRIAVPGDPFTLAGGSFSATVFEGSGYDLALGGQNCTDCWVYNAYNVDGTNTGTNLKVFRSTVARDSGTIQPGRFFWFQDSLLGGTVTMGLNHGTLQNVQSQRETTPIVDFGAAIGGSELFAHNYHGYLELQNVGQSGADVVLLSGRGVLTINANCVGGTISVYGHWDVTDNGTSTVNSYGIIGPSLDTDSNGRVRIVAGYDPGELSFSSGRIENRFIGSNSVFVGAGTQRTSTSADTTSIADTTITTTLDGYYHGFEINPTSGDNFGHIRTVVWYDGTGKEFFVWPPWDYAQGAGTLFLVNYARGPVPDSWVDHGVAQAGTASSITLRSGASALDNDYKWGQVVLVGGTGAGAKADILTYDGTTKVAMTNPVWRTNPDATTIYLVIAGTSR
jgi:hypothetical protein